VTTSTCTSRRSTACCSTCSSRSRGRITKIGRRQKQGQAKAKAAGKYVGRPENSKRTAKIAAVFRAGASHSAIQEAAGCGPATVAKIAKHVQKAATKSPDYQCLDTKGPPHQAALSIRVRLATPTILRASRSGAPYG
jgi:hypothetical protein